MFNEWLDEIERREREKEERFRKWFEKTFPGWYETINNITELNGTEPEALRRACIALAEFVMIMTEKLYKVDVSVQSLK
ncbi:hypothetical protein [Desulfofundulus thermosubterraneus]|uniref:Uncharacterized protein n=1 Tax=Desulfofundulus thermosubterraneus DSM 16057 TaxID=1121432 RepID=A0A1M6ETX1_9FIRM|nr:hypothetical protein [Desulfofundulus thermosubterraneus]SHI88895.1 hypothetical protein SAMN02745219_01277 [Desulfofundulus thermosubterraneus DSM 16057]